MPGACLILALRNILLYRTVYKKAGLSLDRFQPRNGDGNRNRKPQLASIGGPAFQSAAMRSSWRSEECSRVDQPNANAVLLTGQNGLFIAKWRIQSVERSPASVPGAVTFPRTVCTYGLHGVPAAGSGRRAYDTRLLRSRHWPAPNKVLPSGLYRQPLATGEPADIAREPLALGISHAA